MQRGVGRGIRTICSKGTNFQSTTKPGQAADRGDPALPASAAGPRSRRSPGAETPSARPPPAYQSHEPETPRGARPARLPPPTRQPAPVQAHPPVHGLTGDMRSSRRSIGALQKGTRLLLRQTPFCCLQLSHPTSLPSLPLP